MIKAGLRSLQKTPSRSTLPGQLCILELHSAEECASVLPAFGILPSTALSQSALLPSVLSLTWHHCLHSSFTVCFSCQSGNYLRTKSLCSWRELERHKCPCKNSHVKITFMKGKHWSGYLRWKIIKFMCVTTHTSNQNFVFKPHSFHSFPLLHCITESLFSHSYQKIVSFRTCSAFDFLSPSHLSYSFKLWAPLRSCWERFSEPCFG